MERRVSSKVSRTVWLGGKQRWTDNAEDDCYLSR